MPRERRAQLAYSETSAPMVDEASRRAKAAKIAAVIGHFRGVDTLEGLRIADVGCSAGIVADELAARGASVTGFDIDVPGLGRAQRAFGERVRFTLADSQRLPVVAAAFDVIVCNHVYEHVVSAEHLMAELTRVVAPDGMLYLGLGNRLGIMEPHYRLPFLSWLPRPLADRYVRASGRADHYHESFRTRRGLRSLCAGLTVWDYTPAVLAQPERFAADGDVARAIAAAPAWLHRVALPLVPTYLWVATPRPSRPAGPSLAAAPSLVATA